MKVNINITLLYKQLAQTNTMIRCRYNGINCSSHSIHHRIQALGFHCTNIIQCKGLFLSNICNKYLVISVSNQLNIEINAVIKQLSTS